MNTAPRFFLCPVADRRRSRRGARRGFTLLEVLVSLTIFSLAMGLAMVAYVAVLKRAKHTETMLKGATEVRYASDMISQQVRSAARSPSVAAGGLQLIVPPAEGGYVTVEDITFIDQPRGVRGSKANQRVMKFSDVTITTVASRAIFKTSARPAGALTGSDLSTYFDDMATTVATNMDDYFDVGDTITIPATPYGAATTCVINSINNSSSNHTLTMTQALGVNVPSGTKIAAVRGRRMMFEVRSRAQTGAGSTPGDLRYYPDDRDLSRFIVLAHDIDPDPREDPSDSTSAASVPFVVSGRYVTLNLQLAPKGQTFGRTVQGVQTTVLARTDPSQ